MQIARVIGNVVSTSKSEKLDGLKLLIVKPIDLDTFQEKGAPIVSIDTVGAGEGEIVMVVGGSSSRADHADRRQAGGQRHYRDHRPH